MNKAIWTLPAAGFVIGALFGAVALGDLIPRDADGRDAAPAGDAQRPKPAADAPASTREGARGAAAKLAVSAEEAWTAEEAAPAQAPAATDLEARLDSVLALWKDAQSGIAELQTRLARVEQRLDRRAREDEEDRASRPRPPRTADERRDALISAGVDPGLADDLIWDEAQVALGRLELRDQAVREGWAGTARYREELKRIDGESRSLREHIGEDAWDRYLYVTGADNRVRVASVIPGSAAEAAGVRPGDLIETYAGDRVFDFGELRGLTTAGEGGELVLLEVRRNTGAGEVWVPRGPLGVRLESARVDPLR